MEKIKRHYVYELRKKATINSVVFYVGKGVMDRVDIHVKLVSNKIKNNIEINSRKEKAIAELLDKDIDGEIQPLIIGRYDTKEEAEAVESTLINWIYGIGNLTNISRGRGASSIRNRGDFNFDNNLDDKRTRKQKFEDYGNTLNLNEKANILREKLKEHGILNTEDPSFKRGAQDFTFNWSVPETDFYLEFKFNTSDDTVVINSRPYKGFEEEFIILAELAGYKLSNKEFEVFGALAEFKRKPALKDGIKFGSYLKGVPIEKTEDIAKLVQDFQIRMQLARVYQKIIIEQRRINYIDIAETIDKIIGVFTQRPEEKHRF